MRFLLTLTTAVPSTGIAMAGMYGATGMGAPPPVAVGAGVVLFWLTAYRIAGLLEAIAAHRATRD